MEDNQIQQEPTQAQASDGIAPAQQTYTNDVIPGTEEPTAGQPNTQQQPAPANMTQQQQDAWDAAQYQLNYRGQMYQPKDKQHLISLAQQGLSYSQSMAALKQEQEQLKGRYGQYEQLETLFKERPELGPKFAQLLMEQQNQIQQGHPIPQNQQLPPELLQKISELDNFKQTYVAEQADKQLDGEIEKLKGKYSDQSWDIPDPTGKGTLTYRVLQHAYEGQFSSLESAFKDLMFESYVQSTKASTLQKAKENRQQQTRAGVVTGSRPSAPPPAQGNGYKQGDGYGDLVKKALASLS